MNVETKSKQSNTNVYEMDSAFQYVSFKYILFLFFKTYFNLYI